MKKIITMSILLILLGLTLDNKEIIMQKIDTYLYPKRSDYITSKNEYYRNYDFNYVKNTNIISPHSKQDILNIYYTAINSGHTNFSFYCPKEYKNCLTEVNAIAKDQNIISDINNFVHPFNSFTNIETFYDSLGKVVVTLQKTYTPEEITTITNKVEEVASTLINTQLSTIDNIKNIHDYIINNTKYDSNRTDNNIINYKSDIAYGPLIEGYGICGGYTDTMQLFLEKLNIKNYKIATNNHIWNAIYLDNQWYHLDLTWDDPVTSNNTDVLEHNFFLINTEELLTLETTEHSFNQTVYSELKEA